MKNILIIGIDSIIGSSVKKHLQTMGHNVIGTTRRHDHQNDETLLLDLLNLHQIENLPDTDSVLIAAGYTRIKECDANPEIAFKLNVKAPMNILKRYRGTKTTILGLSTNQVFDGCTPLIPHVASYSWKNEYGKTKAEMEKALINIEEKTTVSILRLTKVIQPNYPLFRTWIEALGNGDIIQPFEDLLIAPISLRLCTEVISKFLLEQHRGIFQLSNNSDLSYSDIARKIAQLHNMNENLIVTQCAAAGGFSGYNHPFNSLETYLPFECEHETLDQIFELQ